MTYRNLLESLKDLSPEQLDMDVTVFDGENDEFYPVISFDITTETDVLDDNHPFVIF